MLLHNYGLFWRRDTVMWGGRGIPGHLKGTHAKQSKPVDFQDQQGVYVLYDENYSMLYVGQAGGRNDQRLLGRLRKHRNDQLANRWTRFSWFGVKDVDLRIPALKPMESKNIAASVTSILDHIEAILIVAGEPPLNRQGGRFGKSVRQYFQYRDKALGPSGDQMLVELWKSRQAT